MALVIEAKCLKTAQAIQNASAQAVGYFFKLDQIASLYPPLVIVMTEDWVNVMFFPFKRGTELLANCVEFEHVPLCMGNLINLDFLSFILLFTNPGRHALKAVTFPSYEAIK